MSKKTVGKMKYYEEEAIKLGLNKGYFNKMPASTKNRLLKEDGKDLVEKHKNLVTKQNKLIASFFKMLNSLSEIREVNTFTRYLISLNILKIHNQLFVIRQRLEKRDNNKLLRVNMYEQLQLILEKYEEYKKLK